MSEKLLPCPFCGGTNVTEGLLGMTEKFLGLSNSDATRWFARVQCLDCGTQQGYAEAFPITGPKVDGEHDAAIAAWNRRTPAPEGEAWRTVPVEPTKAMLNAAIDVDPLKLGDISLLGFRISPQMLFERCWSAMLAASPVVPVGVEEVARIIFDATYDARHGSTSEMEAFWSRCDEAADAILAALRPTDTGANHD